MNTILYGNGFNRLNDVDSWENLVHVIDDSNDNCKVPNTLQYEGKVLSLPYETEAKIRTSDGNILVTSDHKILTVRERNETIIKKEIANQMKAYKSNYLFDKFSDINDLASEKDSVDLYKKKMSVKMLLYIENFSYAFNK